MEGIKKGLNRLYNVSLFTSVVVLAIGIFLFINPGTVMDIIAVIVGILFLIPGVTALVDYFKEKNQASLFSGIILILISIIIIAYRKLIESIFPFIFGIFFVINGINRLQYALSVRKEYKIGDSRPLFMAILIMLCGVIFIIYPLTVAETAFQIMGLFLCIYSILDIVNHMVVKKDIKTMSNEMKNAIIEVEANEK